MPQHIYLILTYTLCGTYSTPPPRGSTLIVPNDIPFPNARKNQKISIKTSNQWIRVKETAKDERHNSTARQWQCLGKNILCSMSAYLVLLEIKLSPLIYISASFLTSFLSSIFYLQKNLITEAISTTIPPAAAAERWSSAGRRWPEESPSPCRSALI